MLKISKNTKLEILINRVSEFKLFLYEKLGIDARREKIKYYKLLKNVTVEQFALAISLNVESFLEEIQNILDDKLEEPFSIEVPLSSEYKNQEENKYEASLVSVDLFLLQFDSNQVITYVNSSFAKYFNKDKSYFLNKKIEKLDPLLLRNSFFDVIMDMDENNSTSKFLDKNGNHFSIKLTKHDAQTFNFVIEDTSEKYKLKQYIDKYVMSGLDEIDEEKLSSFRVPEKRDMSVSFTDLRGFTALSEKLDASKVRDLINEYFDVVIDVVNKNNGTIDKLVGDEVMALYGAPLSYKNHAFIAIKTALEQIEKVECLRKKLQKEGKELPQCGIGINSGEMLVGSIGGKSRQDYTVLGTNVNLAARLCDNAIGGQVILTESALNSLLANLPNGWEYVISNRGEQSEHLGETDSNTFLPLPAKFSNILYEIGEIGKPPIYRFQYIYMLNVKGFEKPIPVIEALWLNKLVNTDNIDVEDIEGGSEKIFGKYRLLNVISKGKMSDVYKARDTFGNTVAIKTLKFEYSQNENIVNAFKNEAKLMSQFDHRNICRIYEIGVYENINYIAMEYIEGNNLQNYIDEKYYNGIGDQFAIKLIRQILDALQYSHENGVIHRDIKPSNIMLRNKSREPVLMDFGLAVELDEKNTEVQSYDVIGTLEFMAPELVDGKKIKDERIDIFSVGAVLYYLVTNKKWFTANEDINIISELKRLKNHEILPPKKINPKIGYDLENIILKSMDKEPLRRYLSAKTFNDDLQRYLDNQPILAAPPKIMYRISKAISRNRSQFYIILVGLLLFLFAGFLFYKQFIKEVFSWTLVFSENFSSGEKGVLITDNWKFLNNLDGKGFENKDILKTPVWTKINGVLEGCNSGGIDNLVYKRSIPGNIRVEWDICSKKNNLNYNCFIGGSNSSNGYTFHIGAMGNPDYMFLSKGKNLEILDSKEVKNLLKINIVYHFRMEKENDHIRFFINNRKIFDYVDYDILKGPGYQQFGFENMYGNIMEFDNIKVYYQALPQRISPLAVADKLFQLKNYKEAIKQYNDILFAYSDMDIAKIALFKKGLSYIKMGETTKGNNILNEFESKYPDNQLVPISMYERTKIIKNNQNLVDKMYVEIANKFPKHSILKTIFNNKSNQEMSVFNKKIKYSKKIKLIEKGRENLLYWGNLLKININNNRYMSKAAQFYRKHGDFKRVLTVYSTQKYEVAWALLSLGRFDEIVKNYSQFREQYGWALFHLGKMDEILKNFEDQRKLYAKILLMTGEYLPLLDSYIDQREEYVIAYLLKFKSNRILTIFDNDKNVDMIYYFYKKNFKKVIKIHRGLSKYRAMSYLYLNRYNTVIKYFGDDNYLKYSAYNLKYLNLIIKKRYRDAKKVKKILVGMNFDYSKYDMLLGNLLVPVFSDYLSGRIKKDELNRAFSEYKNIYDGYIRISAKFILGNVSDYEYLSQNIKIGMKENLILLKAMHYDYIKEYEFAYKFYREYSNFTLFQKIPDPIVDKFVDWRIKTLKRFRK